MKTILKSIITASLLFATTAASAQKVIVQDLEDWMGSLISRAIDNNVEVSKSLGQERDIQKEGTPMKWRCDIMTFTLPKKQRPLLDEMIKAFEANGHDNPLCYGINTLTTGNSQNEGKRNLIIGDDINRYVTIGKDYTNYINVNILDAQDTTKTHRYAYALEWRETSPTSEKSAIDVRYIVTYAKIPSNNEIYQKKLNSLGNVNIQDKISISGDSAFNVIREVNGKPYKVIGGALNQAIDDNKILLIFSTLKQYYQNHKDAELTAISIYNLCKKANENGLFKDDFFELEQMISDVDELTKKAKTETDRTYFQMARAHLVKILRSRNKR